MTGPARQAEEARVIKLARDSAVRRVESTVRHMRNNAPAIRLRNLYPAARPPAPRRPRTGPATEAPVTASGREAPTEVLVVTPPEEPTEKLVATPAQEVATATDKLTPKHAAGDVERGPAEPGFGQDRLRRLLAFVARQQPELRWAVGDRADGTTVLVTDLAHGWIPPGIVLPAGVRLLEPGQRSGNLAALLGPTTVPTTYAPGDRLGRATDFDPIESSSRPRELPMIDDLGRLLGEATHWRDGLPRLAHTLAKAGAAGTGVVDAEMDLLRVNLDTVRYQLLTQYPDIDPALLSNCLLLAATEGIAAGDTVSANYHFAWFRALSARRPAAEP